MVMKDGMGWGDGENDGHTQSSGWLYPPYAKIYDPRFVKNPEDVTYRHSPYIKDLQDAKIVSVVRTTVVTILG